MVYYTGDTHGQAAKIQYFIRRFQIANSDIIVILGDAGINYFGNNHGDKKIKSQLNDLGTTILCIHGNHELRPETLSYYREIDWHGGIVYIEDEFPNLLFAKDGEILDLDGQKSIVIGGAYSVDKYYRLRRGLKWFLDEQPSLTIKEHVETVLNSVGWKIDTVLSHTCPAKYIPTEAFMTGIDQSMVDHSTELWLDTIEERVSYKHWLCGHWHIDKRIDKMHFLMEGIECLRPTQS